MFWQRRQSKLDQVLAILSDIQTEMKTMAHTLDETLAAAQDGNTKEDSLLAFVGGLEKQLADALSGVKLSDAQQAKVDAIFDAVTSNATKSAAALAANVPPDPVPAPQPGPQGGVE